MNIIKKLVLIPSQVLDALHSLSFCLRCFSWTEAWRLPIIVSRNVKIGNIYKGCVSIQSPLRRAMIRIGQQGYAAVAEQEGIINIEKGGILEFKGTARFGQGVRLWIDNAKMTIGDNFYCNKNCMFRAYDDISIGDNVLMGWDIEMNTSDGHEIILEGEFKINHKPITLGNHVWVASHVCFSKGASVQNDSVVAQHSLVTKRFEEDNLLLGGEPAKILQSGINWKE